MKYQRTQILLDPEEHRRLTKEAADRGISLAEYIRQIVAARPARAGEEAASYGTGFEGITALFSLPPMEGDIVEGIGETIQRHVREEYERDMGRRPRKSVRKGRSPR